MGLGVRFVIIISFHKQARLTKGLVLA